MQSRKLPSGGALRHLSRAPAELTAAPLLRLGEGIGKIVYASPHWVVKVHRKPDEILALIVLWRLVRRFERHLPQRLRGRLIDHPAPQLRLLRMLVYLVILIGPRSLWYWTRAGSMMHRYRLHDRRGEHLARKHLAGTDIVPETISFPPVRVRIGGWPGWCTVAEATERVESTLDARLRALAAAGRFDEVEMWLQRLVDARQHGWSHGVFSTDAHLKNWGVVGDRLVLIDAGGLTANWPEIERKLENEESLRPPHARLGLDTVLAGRPDIAARFDEAWHAAVSSEGVREQWPDA